MGLFLLAFFGGVLGTILALMFGYVDFSDFSNHGWKSALTPLFIWPWISFPIILTLSTMAWPFVVITVNPKTDFIEMANGSMSYLIITTLTSVALAYPGGEVLGLWDEGSVIPVIGFTGVVQFFVAFFTFSGIEDLNDSKGFYRRPSRLRKMFCRSNDNERGPTYRELPISPSFTKGGVGVDAGLGPVELECNVSCAWDSWRTLETGGGLWVAKGSSITTKHSLFVDGQLEVLGGSISSDNVITLKTGRYVMGDLKARHLISFGDLTIDGDLTVSGSVICEGRIVCSGRISVGGVIEAHKVCSPDPDRVRSENTIGGCTTVGALET